MITDVQYTQEIREVGGAARNGLKVIREITRNPPNLNSIFLIEMVSNRELIDVY